MLNTLDWAPRRLAEVMCRFGLLGPVLLAIVADETWQQA